ncbi:unnamed protein product [Parajaminaea phylloscopi]
MTLSESYKAAASLHASAPSFAPVVPVSSLPYIAIVLLLASFFGAFYFTTLPKQRSLLPEVTVALASSVCAGFGVVALFNAVGVYV